MCVREYDSPRRRAGEVEDLSVVNAATGLVGVTSLVVALPGFPILDAVGKETFELPDGGVLAWLVLNGEWSRQHLTLPPPRRSPERA